MAPPTNGIQRPKITEVELDAARAIVRPNLVKQRMQSGQLAHAFGLRLCFSVEIPLVAKKMGYSAILMNLEHMAMSNERMSEIAVSCLTAEITPMVVVPACTQEWISRSLDSGAQAVIVPHVNNVEQARLCANAAKFPPLGHRSVMLQTAMQQYSATGMPFPAVCQVTNDNTLIMPMIETPEGVENVEEIAKVPGIDCLLVGCADLSMEYGIPQDYYGEQFRALLDRIAQAATDAGIFVGLGGLESFPKVIEELCMKWPCIRFAMATRDLSLLLVGMKNNAQFFNDLSSRLR